MKTSVSFITISSFPHLPRRPSGVIGAGTKNPEDVTPLRPFLSSKEMLIALDDAESILYPQGMRGGIYTATDGLSRFSNICLCIPPDSETLGIPILLAEAAHDTFYRKRNELSDLVNDIPTSTLSLLYFTPRLPRKRMRRRPTDHRMGEAAERSASRTESSRFLGNSTRGLENLGDPIPTASSLETTHTINSSCGRVAEPE